MTDPLRNIPNPNAWAALSERLAAEVSEDAPGCACGVPHCSVVADPGLDASDGVVVLERWVGVRAVASDLPAAACVGHRGPRSARWRTITRNGRLRAAMRRAVATVDGLKVQSAPT
mgnify:CR=1 FL=1